MSGITFKPIVNFPGVGDAMRGDRIIVGYKSELRTAVINRFFNPDGDAWHEVDAAIIIGADRGGSTQKPVWEYAGEGVAFRHINDPYPTGNRFCFPHEGEEACRRVWDAMNGEASGYTPDPIINPTAPPQPVPPEPAEQEFDPADRNRDGVVTKKEQKQYDRGERG